MTTAVSSWYQGPADHDGGSARSNRVTKGRQLALDLNTNVILHERIFWVNLLAFGTVLRIKVVQISLIPLESM